jgi:glycosyltransferase involved in cell wall biosynthesis
MNVLVFAYVFPPDAGSGTYRTLYFANEWARHADNITVITVRETDFQPDALVDRNLADHVEPRITVVRARALRPLQLLIGLRTRLRKSWVRKSDSSAVTSMIAAPARARSWSTRLKDVLTAMLTFPDEHIGWVPDAVRKSMALTRATRFDCIYATGGPWSALLAATILHMLTRIPLVIDFRDPWASNPNLAARPRIVRRAHAWLEHRCVNSASRVIVNTRELRDDFEGRYLRARTEKFVCVTNGFEKLPPHTPRRSDRFTLIHAGALYLSRNPANFLRAIEHLVASGAVSRDSIRVQFVGGIDVHDPRIDASLRALGESVIIVPRVAHGVAIEMQRDANVLLLFQTGFPLQVPRKLYEYLSFAVPILAIADEQGATARILREIGFGYVTDDDERHIAEALLALYRAWQSPQGIHVDQTKLYMYSNEYLAERLRQAMHTTIRSDGG